MDQQGNIPQPPPPVSVFPIHLHIPSEAVFPAFYFPDFPEATSTPTNRHTLPKPNPQLNLSYTIESDDSGLDTIGQRTKEITSYFKTIEGEVMFINRALADLNPRSVEQICRAVDNISQALELAKEGFAEFVKMVDLMEQDLKVLWDSY
ncbi:hypothetical protein VTJ04DRAFT_5240 [Mycothermus thermophilus]|uniref:uncharacterized protein n=1 Tax=Humicola insolens TaxID=85995 RepID=UPI003742735D